MRSSSLICSHSSARLHSVLWTVLKSTEVSPSHIQTSLHGTKQANSTHANFCTHLLLSHLFAGSAQDPSLVVLHCFSNGGVLLALSMLAEARHRGRLLKFDAAVFDSAPTRRLLPIASPLVIASSGLPPLQMAKTLARHVPYAIAAQLASPLIGTPAPAVSLGIDTSSPTIPADMRTEASLFLLSRSLLPSFHRDSFPT